jgi:hypothetical protein
MPYIFITQPIVSCAVLLLFSFYPLFFSGAIWCRVAVVFNLYLHAKKSEISAPNNPHFCVRRCCRLISSCSAYTECSTENGSGFLISLCKWVGFKWNRLYITNAVLHLAVDITYKVWVSKCYSLSFFKANINFSWVVGTATGLWAGIPNNSRLNLRNTQRILRDWTCLTFYSTAVPLFITLSR